MTLSPRKWTAILLAGQRPGVDQLASHFGEAYKALVKVCGVAMVTRVVQTLIQSSEVTRVVVLAQDPAVLAGAVAAGGAATIITSTAGISESIRAIAGTDDAPWPVLVTTADHPLLTADCIEAFLWGAEDCDLAVAMVERATILAAYPDTKRTWLRFRDGAWSGANLFALNTERARAALDLWAEAEQDRKRAWRLFLHFGPWLAIRAITRTIGLAHAFDLAGQRLGLKVKLVALDFADAAIDVDKPSDHSLAEHILQNRSNQA